MPHFRSSLAQPHPHPHRTATPTATTGPEAHYAAVCAVLWSERELLESLACTLIVEQLMTHTGAARRAADHVQQDAMRRLGLQEVLRGAIVDALLNAIAAPPTASLRELADGAPEPWATILREHRESLTTLSSDLCSLAGFEQLSLHEFLG